MGVFLKIKIRGVCESKSGGNASWKKPLRGYRSDLLNIKIIEQKEEHLSNQTEGEVFE